MATGTVTLSKEEKEKQVKEVEELLGKGPEKLGFAKSLFDGKFAADWVMPYPQIEEDQREEADALRMRVRDFARNHIDAAAIDRNADIPREVIDGLAETGLFRTTAPKEYGGLGLNQKSYCRALEEVAAVCGSTALFVNVQHSIGLRAFLLFGTQEQNQKWLPPIVAAEKLAAFALTEEQAGSDAGNVQTTATPSEDGRFYTLNGHKRYITSGGIADVLTVMARTPDPKKPDGAITAFIVTPEMKGFEVVEERMEKMGCRGTATGRLKFTNMKVPAENVFGKPGKGLRIGLTVLDFGRVTFGAVCTGVAKECVRLATEFANSRIQFKQPIANFELVQKKIARMSQWAYAMESMTRVTAHMIDRGLEDYMLETAMLKVYCTENLWTIVNDAFQVHGGAAYFCDRPLERILRDNRINQIGEGANEVLSAFIALVGMRYPGEKLQTSWGYRFQRVARLQPIGTVPHIPVRSSTLNYHASRLGRLIHKFDNALFMAMFKHKEAILDRQLVQERIANAAMELFAMSCVISRLDSELINDGLSNLRTRPDHVIADAYLYYAARHITEQLRGLRNNDDKMLLTSARSALGMN